MGTELTGTHKQVFEKEKTRREKLSGFFYDLAKLMFAGTFIVNIPMLFSLEITFISTANLIFGILLTTVLAWIANRLLTY